MSGDYYAMKRAFRESTLSVVFAEIQSMKIADSGGTIINPSTRENQDTMINHLSNIATNVDVALSTRASESTLSGIKSQTDKLFSQEVVVDYSNTSPAASTDYYTEIANISDRRECWVFVKADQAIDVVVLGGFTSDGSDFAPLSGYKIQSADFQTDEWNNIEVAPRIPYIRVKVTTGTTAPSYIYVKVVKAY